jgi:MFS family permease
LGALTTPGILYGLAWKPSGLITFESDVPRLDVSPFASLLISPLFIGTAVLLYLFSLMGDRFLLHQLRRLVSEEPRRGAVLASSAGLALLGLTQPPLMTSALWCAIAGLALLVHDALCYL